MPGEMQDKGKDINTIRRRLNLFSRRFYLDQLLSNAAIYLSSALAILLFVSILEYLANHDSQIRAAIFYAFLMLVLAGLVYLVVMPAMRAAGILRGMSQIELSKQIGRRVKEVDDKLQNILLLGELQRESDSEILRAAIDQKSHSISSIPFHLSAGFRRGLKFIKISAAFLVVVSLLGFAFPDLFNYGTRRVIYYDQEISPAPPFRFILDNEARAILNEPYPIGVRIEGELLPQSLNVVIDGRVIKAIKTSQNEFSHTIRNVSGDFTFYLEAEGHRSHRYKIEARNKPAIVRFTMDLEFPSYLRRKPERLENQARISVPEGTRIIWQVEEANSEFIEMTMNGEPTLLNREGGMTYTSTPGENMEYSLCAVGPDGLRSDSMLCSVTIIPDGPPSIQVVQESDSADMVRVFVGRISDDHGFTAFRFASRINDGDQHVENLPFAGKNSSWDFVYEIDWNAARLNMGDEVTYYFEVCDNDGVHGPKCTRSTVMRYRLMEKAEMEARLDEMGKDIEDELKKAADLARELREDIEKVEKSLLEKENVDWSTEKEIQEILRQNAELKKMVDRMAEQNSRKNRMSDDLSNNEVIREKQARLERMMEEIMDDEMLSKLRELEFLMEKLKDEEVREALKDIEITGEQLEEELDRGLELFRQLEFEMQLEKVITDLGQLQQEQEKVLEETKQGSEKDLKGEQEKIAEKFDQWKKDAEKLREMNDNLQNKHDVKDQSQKSEEVSEEMKQAGNELQKGKKNNAGQHQQGASDKMSEMKDDLMALQMSMQADAAEDLQSLRNTLENLLELSFEQEKLMSEMKQVQGDDPRFNDATKEQRAIYDAMMVVEDSLRALGRRIVQIETSINREVAATKSGMEKTIRAMTERKQDEIMRHQQLSMTSINNLALLLDEAINQMQQQMMQSTGQCSKPGQSKPSSSTMKSMQQELNRQIEEMKKGLEQGKAPGGHPGEKGKEAESLAKMAARQARIREELRKMADESSQQEASELKKLGELMEQTEKDIVNREITRETLLRQEKILTRLLETERSDREQDMDKKREASEGKQKNFGNLFDKSKYYKTVKGGHEDLIRENITFSRYYKGKIEEYFKIIDQ